MKPEALMAAAFVTIAIGSCAWRHSEASRAPMPMSPAQEARAKQMHEALQTTFPVEQRCAKQITFGDTLICISAEQLKRMEEQRK